MPKFNPWEAGRTPLAEDERPYSDAKRPGVVIPPIRFREMGATEEDAFFARRREYLKQWGTEKKEGGQNRAVAPLAAAACPSPLFGEVPGTQPAAAQVFAPKAIPEGAFSRLPPEAQAGILAGVARKQGVGALYEAPDGKVERLSNDLITNCALFETMQVRPAGEAGQGWEPYTFDDWVGFALNYYGAYRAMSVVCMALNQGKEPPAIGAELSWNPEEAPLARPPGPKPSPSTPTVPSSAVPGTPTPSSTQAPPSEASPPPSAPSGNGSEKSPDSSEYSPELTAALQAAQARLVGT